MGFWTSLKNIFKNYFIAGTLVLLPVAATLWVLKTLLSGRRFIIIDVS
jgi:uncharacterized membrane protein